MTGAIQKILDALKPLEAAAKLAESGAYASSLPLDGDDLLGLSRDVAEARAVILQATRALEDVIARAKFELRDIPRAADRRKWVIERVYSILCEADPRRYTLARSILESADGELEVVRDGEVVARGRIEGGELVDLEDVGR